jgi:chemotaxis protein methyltransferase CheR
VTRRVAKNNPHLRTLERAIAVRFGWRPGGAIREAIVHLAAHKAQRIGMDEVSYCLMAASSPAELDAVAEDVAPSDSRFFDGQEWVDALRERVLPGLSARRMERRRLRLWSAGCASGEEAYTLAILTRESIPSIDDWHVELLATDLRGRAVVAASRGRYRAPAVRGIDPTIRNRYFIGVDEPGPDREFDVIPLVRRMATFRRLNLCDAAVLRSTGGPYDVVLCRNVLLYFCERAVELVVSRLAEAIAPDGYLVVSPIETQLISQTYFRPVESLPLGFFRVAEHAPSEGVLAAGDESWIAR